jgi:adenylyltransferase/sulfurtransferase
VLGALPLTIGGFAALLAIRAIAGMGDDAGKLHLLDADRLAWRAIALPADPGCRSCGAPPQSG